MTSTSSVKSVFNLYQEGLEPDHVLQLCYLRRRTSRRFRLDCTRIEDEFVLPRPELKLASFLPSDNFSLDQVIELRSPSSQSSNNARELGPPMTINGIDQVRESAQMHYLNPRQATIEEASRWATLTESDWLTIHQNLQQTSERTDQCAVGIPDIVDVCWILEHCHSDAFVSFLWDHLLLSLLQQCVGSDMSAHLHLFTLLVNHHSLASLNPKDFRAKVRSRNLRQVDNIFGAQAELALIELYQKQRNC